MHVLDYFYSVQTSFFYFCQFGWHCGVTTMLLIHPQVLPSQPLNSVTVLKSPLASSPATELGRMPVSLSSLYWYTFLIAINNFTWKGYSMSAVFFYPSISKSPSLQGIGKSCIVLCKSILKWGCNTTKCGKKSQGVWILSEGNVSPVSVVRQLDIQVHPVDRMLEKALDKGPVWTSPDQTPSESREQSLWQLDTA
jgi:hypothetical protein